MTGPVPIHDRRSSLITPDDTGSLESPSWAGPPIHGVPSAAAHSPWRVRDRTHLELNLRYPHARERYRWDVYFFIPESLRVTAETYPASQIYKDLSANFQHALPALELHELVAGGPLGRLASELDDDDEETRVAALRLFACQVHIAVRAARRELNAVNHLPQPLTERAAALLEPVRALNRATAALLLAPQSGPEASPLTVAARWADEDISRMLESLLVGAARDLEEIDVVHPVIGALTALALDQARYRQARGLSGVCTLDASKQELEHVGFRRHVLKRFAASMLWVESECSEPGNLMLEVLYGVAAGVAMAFAVAASLWNGLPTPDKIWLWATIAVLAYIGKDRLKSRLQAVFSGLIDGRMPDRRWTLRDRGGALVAQVDEQTDVLDFEQVPRPVLAARRTTRAHPLEEEARPETVLHHHKLITLQPRRSAWHQGLDETFRLDLGPWLKHASDPKEEVLFADLESGTLGSRSAPRVYNIAVVYRLRAAGAVVAPWQRARVVVTRKGIRRIDHL